jgi:hypothetical protein
MTDISISEQAGISYDEIDKKIKQISYYIKRVHQRNNAIDNFIKANRIATQTTVPQLKLRQKGQGK